MKLDKMKYLFLFGAMGAISPIVMNEYLSLNENATVYAASAATSNKTASVKTISVANNAPYAQISLPKYKGYIVSSYTIERTGGLNGKKTFYPSSTAYTYSDRTVVQGTQYTYKITTKVRTTSSTRTSNKISTLTTTVPVTKYNISSVCQSSKGVSLTFPLLGSGNSYTLIRTCNGVNKNITLASGSRTYTDTSVGANYLYTYKIQSKRGIVTATGSASSIKTKLSAVTGLNLSVSGTNCTIKWNSTSLAKSYKVYRNSKAIATVSGCSYTDKGLTKGTTYKYYVVPCGTAIGSTLGPACASKSITIPKDKNDSKNPPDNTIKPSIKPDNTDTGGTGGGGGGGGTGGDGDTTPTPTPTPTEPEKPSITLTPPKNITAQNALANNGNGSKVSAIKLKWDEVKDATGYRIYRNNQLLKYVGKVTEDYDLTAESGNVYKYHIIAEYIDSKTEYEATSAASGAVEIMKLDNPEITFKVVSEKNSIGNTVTTLNITWGKIPGASQYKVYEKVNNEWIVLSTTNKTTYSLNIDATNRVDRIFTVKVIKGIDPTTNKEISAMSGYVENKFTILPQPQNILAFSSVEGDKNYVELRWDKIEGATSYKVYRRKVGETDFVEVSECKLIQDNVYKECTNEQGKSLARCSEYEYSVSAVSDNNIESAYDIDGVAVHVNHTTDETGKCTVCKKQVEYYAKFTDGTILKGSKLAEQINIDKYKYSLIALNNREVGKSAFANTKEQLG